MTSEPEHDEFADLRELQFMESRIPVLDALSAFVAENSQPQPRVQEEIEKHRQSRWYPVPGGLRVLVPHDHGSYDAESFTLQPKGWDHDTCDVCQKRIPAMTLCWVTRAGQYITLCVDCKARMETSATVTKSRI